MCVRLLCIWKIPYRCPTKAFISLENALKRLTISFGVLEIFFFYTSNGHKPTKKRIESRIWIIWGTKFMIGITNLNTQKNDHSDHSNQESESVAKKKWFESQIRIFPLRKNLWFKFNPILLVKKDLLLEFFDFFLSIQKSFEWKRIHENHLFEREK